MSSKPAFPEYSVDSSLVQQGASNKTIEEPVNFQSFLIVY